jgi:hypothetical protein
MSNNNRTQQSQSQPSQCQQPLIQLLDGVLAQSERRVKIAVTEITRMLLDHNGTILQLPHPDQSTLSCVLNLHCLLQTLLQVFPEFASYPSQRDVSLPLHFAASIGNIQVASLLMSKVRRLLIIVVIVIVVVILWLHGV